MSLFKIPIALAASVILWSCADDRPAQRNTVVAGAAQIGGPYSLTDQNGRPVTQADFIGRPQLIYFGFGYCPDVCPTSLMQMDTALAQLKPRQRARFQPLFITVDPKRDTPEKLAQFVKSGGFPKGLTGLTGSPDQIKAVQKSYGIYSEKVTDPSSSAGYTFDHTSTIILMDAAGEFYDMFTHRDSPDDIAKVLKSLK